MKTHTTILLLFLLLQSFISSAQLLRYQKQIIKTPETASLSIGSSQNDEKVLTPKLVVYPTAVQNQLVVTTIDLDEYDKATVHNMQGAIVLQQVLKSTVVKFDISGFIDGVYLLVLRSSVTLKENSIKFVVKN